MLRDSVYSFSNICVPKDLMFLKNHLNTTFQEWGDRSMLATIALGAAQVLTCFAEILPILQIRTFFLLYTITLVSVGSCQWSHRRTPDSDISCDTWRRVACKIHFWEAGKPIKTILLITKRWVHTILNLRSVLQSGGIRWWSSIHCFWDRHIFRSLLADC